MSIISLYFIFFSCFFFRDILLSLSVLKEQDLGNIPEPQSWFGEIEKKCIMNNLQFELSKLLGKILYFNSIFFLDV